jgi:hypothetical protein
VGELRAVLEWRMLTQLATVKARLAILESETQYDGLLTRAIEAFSARFDRECNRTFARTVGTTQEFPGGEIEIPLWCYPIETVTKFELKSSESAGWVDQTGVDYLVRAKCVVSLTVPLWPLRSSAALARVTYTGGYVLPGNTPGTGQTALPVDLESAAVEQVVFWFQRRDTPGVIRVWPSGGNYMQLVDTDLMPAVRTVLRRHTRFSV